MSAERLIRLTDPHNNCIRIPMRRHCTPLLGSLTTTGSSTVGSSQGTVARGASSSRGGAGGGKACGEGGRVARVGPLGLCETAPLMEALTGALHLGHGKAFSDDLVLSRIKVLQLGH